MNRGTYDFRRVVVMPHLSEAVVTTACLHIYGNT